MFRFLEDREKVASLFIQNGADVNAKDLDNSSPLHLAAWNGNFKNTYKFI